VPSVPFQYCGIMFIAFYACHTFAVPVHRYNKNAVRIVDDEVKAFIGHVTHVELAATAADVCSQ